MDGRLRARRHAGLAVHRAAAPHRHPARRRLTQPLNEDVERELRRVAERIVSLGPARLARPSELLDGATPLGEVRRVAQWLADTAATAEGEPHRDVPELAPHALGDQLVVLTRDALAASGALPEPEREALVDDVHQRLLTLRRSL